MGGGGGKRKDVKKLTEGELLSHKKIRPEIAAKYLQDGTTAQEIRVKAQKGVCPFCTAERPSNRRWVYRVNPGLLIKYKAGELGLLRK